MFECPKCKQQKDSVGPKLIGSTPDSTPINTKFQTQVMCAECYEKRNLEHTVV